jgi:hypothetical protein
VLIPLELDVLRSRWEAMREPDAAVRKRLRATLEARARAAPPAELRVVAARRVPTRLLRRRVLVVAAFLLVIGLTTAASFGVHVPVIDFWSADKVAHSSRVYRDFATLDQGAPAGMATGVVPGETRKVGTIGGATLWVAPTRDGGFCILVGGGGGCDRTGTVPLNVTLSATSPPAGASPMTTPANEFATAVSGYVNGRWADALELRFEDGTTERPPLVWVSKPIDAGFFHVRTTASQRRPGHVLVAAVAETDNGTVISTQPLDRSQPQAPPSDAIVADSRTALRIETRDGPALLLRAPTRYEGRCVWLEFAGRPRVVAPCLIKNYARDGFEWRFVQSEDDVLVVGAVPPNYARVRIGYADGKETEIEPTRDGLDSWLLYELPAAQLRHGAEVTAVSAVTTEGNVIGGALPPELLAQRCYSPLPSPAAARCP